MLIKTKGVVLSFIRFRETSIIVKVFTRELGLQTYIINGVRKQGAPSRIALFQPFTLLDLVAYTSSRGGITRLSEYKCSYPFSSIPFDIGKSSILLFLSEMVTKSVMEEEANPALYHFLEQSIIHFDQQEERVAYFHLEFLLGLSHYLGFGPTSGSDIITQVTLDNAPPSLMLSDLNLQQAELYFQDLITNPGNAMVPNGRSRRGLLQLLVQYYRLHVPALGEVKSLPVLIEVLSD